MRFLRTTFRAMFTAGIFLLSACSQEPTLESEQPGGSYTGFSSGELTARAQRLNRFDGKRYRVSTYLTKAGQARIRVASSSFRSSFNAASGRLTATSADLPSCSAEPIAGGLERVGGCVQGNAEWIPSQDEELLNAFASIIEGAALHGDSMTPQTWIPVGEDNHGIWEYESDSISATVEAAVPFGAVFTREGQLAGTMTESSTHTSSLDLVYANPTTVTAGKLYVWTPAGDTVMVHIEEDSACSPDLPNDPCLLAPSSDVVALAKADCWDLFWDATRETGKLTALGGGTILAASGGPMAQGTTIIQSARAVAAAAKAAAAAGRSAWSGFVGKGMLGTGAGMGAAAQWKETYDAWYEFYYQCWS